MRAASRLMLLCVICILAGTAFPQGTQSGAIAGSVKDPSGAIIGKATITITNNATKAVERTVVSTSEGLFSATLLPPGEYTVEVKAPGFNPATGHVAVLLNTTSRFDATLQVGTASETVEVTANAVTVNINSTRSIPSDQSREENDSGRLRPPDFFTARGEGASIP